jgi:cytochrome b/mono/diheme cytochrome c family protein
MRKVKVWDLFVRFSHWGLGLLVLGSFLTSDEDGLTAIHVTIGLGVLALVAARVAWGFGGSDPARFRSFVRRPREVAVYARELAFGRPPLHRSHNPLGGAMVIALPAVLLALVATGAVVYAGPEFRGPLTGMIGKRNHEHHDRGDHHRRSKGEKPSTAPRSSSDPEGRALYRKECGACHLAYPPHFLPAESPRRIMAGLERHFGGANVELERATRDRIERYLAESSGDAGTAPDVAPGGGAPTRITELRWFQKKHREIAASVVARQSVRSLSNCTACHGGAADWDFDDDRVKIPPS